MSFRLQFWGTRGSIPSPGAATVRYGGNTPCVEVRTSSGWLIVLDAGTGIRELGRSLVARANGEPIRGDIFLSHVHWDHIQGIPFFAPLFQHGNQFTFWASKELEPSLDRVVRGQMSELVFPVAFDELESAIEFAQLADGCRTRQGYEVRTFTVRHPGGALGYRFTETDHDGRAFVYISDNELRGDDDRQLSAWRRALVEFIRGARVLVHDATYTLDEYERHRGWGHSTYEDAVDLALDAGVELLVLFHHKPERTDDEVDALVEACRAIVSQRGATLRILAAAEGLSVTI